MNYLDKLLASQDIEKRHDAMLLVSEVYWVYIKSIRKVLFVSAPPMPDGSIYSLPSNVERKCEQAVIRVLKSELKKVSQALGE